MDFVLQFIDFVYQTISTIWTLVINFVSNLGLMLSNIIKSLDTLMILIQTMPTFIQGAAITTLTVSIIYLILGRGKTN